MELRFKGHLNHYALSGDILLVVGISLKRGISYKGYYYSNGEILSSIINGEHAKISYKKNSLKLQAKYDIMSEKNLHIEMFVNTKTHSGYIYLPYLGKLKLYDVVRLKKGGI